MFVCRGFRHTLWPTPYDLNYYDIGRLLNSWTINDMGESLMDIDGFELYINIARYFRKTTPKEQLLHEIFSQYKVLDTSSFLEEMKNPSNDLRIFDLNIILH